MEEIPGSCRVKPPSSHRAAAKQNQAGMEAKALPGSPEGTSSCHRQHQDFTCEAAPAASTRWKRKQKLFIPYFHSIIVGVAQQRSQKALTSLWDAQKLTRNCG